jgi:hypothetical protein
MNKILFSIAASAVLCAAEAQVAGPYTQGSLVGFVVPALSTNQIGVSQVISEYDYVAFTVTLNGSTASAPAATSTATFRFVQSYDNGLTYETTPSLTYTTPPINGVTPVTYGTNFFCPASSHVKLLEVWNTNAAAFFTNVTAKFLLKQPKRGANTQVN